VADTEEGLTTADIAEGDADATSARDAEPEQPGPLLPADESDRFDDKWKKVQGSFVDEPRQAVEEADKLVASLMQRLATEFSETRAGLERQWESSDNVSTEDLRVAMTRYRSFFERLLAA